MKFSALNTLRQVACAAIVTVSFAAVAHASSLNIVNGSFSSTTNGAGELGYNTNVTGWSTTGYNFVYTGVDSANSGAPGQFGNVALWTTDNKASNGFTTSPDGGNFLAMDGAFNVGALTQTISGFNAGDLVTVSFYYAGAQQAGFYGSNTEKFNVSLGNQSFLTPVLQNSSQGFTGWNSESFTYTATSSSEVLSFLAIGTPSGVPPMSLLDGVSATSNTPVPEPGSLALVATGFVSLGGYVRSRFKK